MMYAIKPNATVVMSDCLGVCCDVGKCIKSAVKTCLFTADVVCETTSVTVQICSNDVFLIYTLQNIWRKKSHKHCFSDLYITGYVCLHSVL